MTIKKWEMQIEIHTDLQTLSSEWKKLWEVASKACEKAYAPYSNFWVGVAILLENNEIIEGVNQENAAYPSGLCAERVGLFSAGIQFPNQKIKMMAVAARRSDNPQIIPVTPCGACRQVMIEFENKQKNPIQVLFQGAENQYYILETVSNLLPLQFNATSLGI
ncbi:MAG: cytidine deaminase [Bacteroidetes bacterium]|nr:MAG: cytidine deaminase [Bacteroidota bacterium]TAG93887.1 MAG: cytidine deaminase [Bacteroidota bacterium]